MQVRLFAIIVTVIGRLLILHSSIDLDHKGPYKQKNTNKIHWHKLTETTNNITES